MCSFVKTAREKEDQRYGGRQEIRQESGFEATDGRGGDDYQNSKISVCIRR
jgi:hypothetical protein